MIDYLELIAKLLAQAEGAGTEAEKMIFTAKAQQLATVNGIDVARARYLNTSKQKTTPEQQSIIIGVPGTEGLKTLVNLYLGIAHANDLRCLIAHNSTRVYAIGFAEDISVSKAIYASLVTQMTGLVEEYKNDGAWREEKVWTEVWKRGLGSDGGAWRNISWRTARLEFQMGFGDRIAGRLFEAKRQAEKQRIAEEVEAEAEYASDDPPAAQRDVGPSTALVLASKREQIKQYYDNEVTKGRGHYSSRSGSNVTSRGAQRAGYAAANRAKLGASTPLGGARKGISQ